jgi:hypothetical protein
MQNTTVKEKYNMFEYQELNVKYYSQLMPTKICDCSMRVPKITLLSGLALI